MSNLQLKADTLLMYFDETGHEELTDPHYPIFGIGGCAILGSDYEETIVNPWKKLKLEQFGDTNISLHATDLRGLSPQQLQAFSDFFTINNFFRMAAVMKITTVIPNEFSAFELISLSVRQRIQEIASRIYFKSMTWIFEASDRLDAEFARNFGAFKTFDDFGNEIPIEKYTMPKSSNEPGLEVADFIIHTAGGQARDHLRGKSGSRKDFEAIFKKVNPELISFIEVNSADFEPI